LSATAADEPPEALRDRLLSLSKMDRRSPAAYEPDHVVVRSKPDLARKLELALGAI
jgi:hypothetical protein